MTEIRYNNPYLDVPVVLHIEEDDTEAIEELVYILDDDARQTKNFEKKEARYLGYHIGGCIYEGMDLVTKEDVAEDQARREI